MVHLKKKIVKNSYLLHIIVLNTHGVHLKKKIVKNAHFLHIIMLDTHGVHLKRKISNFVQGNDETLFMAWERFKDTYNFCLTHGMILRGW